MTAAEKKKKAPAKKKAAARKQPEPAEVPQGPYYGFDEQEWKDLKEIVVVAAMKGKISRKAGKYEDRQVVKLAKRYVLSKGRTHIEKAVGLLCPGEEHPWTALFNNQ